MEHRGAVFRTILARTMDPDAADEATAEAFARAYVHWDDTVAEHPNPLAWVLTANQTMQVSSVAETVTVTASPAIESTATVRTTTVDAEAIANLPINGRRFQDFITLTPTVQVDPQRGQLSFAGQRGINSNVSIDGADYNQPFFGGIRGGERSNNAFTVPQESVQEFQVVAAGYSAEFGRSTGGLVNAITKSGTNSLRGSAFYVNRNRDWAEKNAFGQNAAPTQQQYGGSIGGPIAKNRLFYFGAAESQNFENTRAVVFNLTGIARTADNAEAYDYYRSQETPFETTNDALALLGRMDYQLTGSGRLSLRYSFSDNDAKNANATGNALADTTVSALSNNGTERDRTNTFVGQYTSAIRPNVLLDTRAASFQRSAATRRQRADPTRDKCRRELRDRQFPRPERSGRLALSGGEHPDWRDGPAHLESRPRVQPRRRLADVWFQSVRHLESQRRRGGGARTDVDRRTDRQPFRLDDRHLPEAVGQPSTGVGQRRVGVLRAGFLAGQQLVDAQLRAPLGRGVQPHAGSQQRIHAGRGEAASISR